MKSRFKLLRFLLFLCIFLLASFFLLWWALEWHEDTLYYRIVMKVENKTNEDVTAVIFPIRLSESEVLKNKSTKQLCIKKGTSENIGYYVGKNVSLKNVAVGIAVWRLTTESNEEIFQGAPYLVQTFYDPNFEIGPDKYGIFAHLIIE